MRLTTGWVGSDIPGYREGGNTYNFYAAETLPPLPADVFDGSLSWLTRPTVGDLMAPIDASAELAALGPGLPAPFLTLMTSPELLGSVPSCTDCEWGLSSVRVPGPAEPGTELVRFLNDQQGIAHWYLQLYPDGRHTVVCGRLRYDVEPTVSAADAGRDLVEVAPDIERFLYRFWVENTAWFEVTDRRRKATELSAPVRAYLRHYRL